MTRRRRSPDGNFTVRLINRMSGGSMVAEALALVAQEHLSVIVLTMDTGWPPAELAEALGMSKVDVPQAFAAMRQTLRVVEAADVIAGSFDCVDLQRLSVQPHEPFQPRRGSAHSPYEEHQFMPLYEELTEDEDYMWSRRSLPRPRLTSKHIIDCGRCLSEVDRLLGEAWRPPAWFGRAELKDDVQKRP